MNWNAYKRSHWIFILVIKKIDIYLSNKMCFPRKFTWNCILSVHREKICKHLKRNSTHHNHLKRRKKSEFISGCFVWENSQICVIWMHTSNFWIKKNFRNTRFFYYAFPINMDKIFYVSDIYTSKNFPSRNLKQ